jgi:hypothetical protein
MRNCFVEPFLAGICPYFIRVGFLKKNYKGTLNNLYLARCVERKANYSRKLLQQIIPSFFLIRKSIIYDGKWHY